MRLLEAVAVFTVLQLNQHTQCYYELVEELGCHDSDFRLQCLPFEGQILVLEAFFTENDSHLTSLHTSCGTPGIPTNSTESTSRIDFRHAVNKRCSGKNLCSFTLVEDHPNATRWGPGTVYLRYACTDDSHILKTCTALVPVVGEGFVQTPGYPKFYVGGRPCRWTLKAPPYKQVQIEFLDIALRGVGPLERGCQDWLHVSEHGLDMLETCGDAWDTQVITSVGPELNVSLTTSSVNLFPKRGLLFHYKAVGCKPPNPPEDGYVVTSNNTTIHFRCNIGYVFPDSSHRDRILNCQEPSSEYPVPDCVYVGTDNTTGTEGDVFRMNLTVEITPKTAPTKDSTMSDIVVPCIIVGFLFLANAIILAAVYFYKKRLLEAGPDPWENNLVVGDEEKGKEEE